MTPGITESFNGVDDKSKGRANQDGGVMFQAGCQNTAQKLL